MQTFSESHQTCQVISQLISHSLHSCSIHILCHATLQSRTGLVHVALRLLPNEVALGARRGHGGRSRAARVGDHPTWWPGTTRCNGPVDEASVPKSSLTRLLLTPHVLHQDQPGTLAPHPPWTTQDCCERPFSLSKRRTGMHWIRH